MKNRKLIIIFILILVLFFSVDYSKASYVTSSTSTSSSVVCTPCYWVVAYTIKYICLPGSSYTEDGYPCIIYVYKSSCNSSITSYSNAGSPPPSCSTVSSSTTTYTCHYISSVDTWSECTDGVSIATSVTWSTVPGQVCTDVETTRSCCTDTSWTPDVSTVCLDQVFTQTSNCGATRSAVGTAICNSAPIAEIISPSSSISVDKGDSIDFSGTGTDSDGDAIVAYEWYDGACGIGTPLSTQASFSTASLDGGDHVIYFRVQDEPGLWSDCDSVNVKVYPACDPATAPAGTIFCPGDNSSIEGGVDIAATLVSSASDCTDSKKCEYYHLPIDGDPGSSHNEIFCQKPSENLCDAGTPTIVETGDNGKSWVWTCEGIYDGADVQGKAVRSCAYQEVSPN